MSNRKIIFGLILIALGFLLLSRTLDLFYFDFGDIISVAWPLIIIAIGIWLMARRRGEHQAADAEASVTISVQCDRPTPPPPVGDLAPKAVPPTYESPPPPGGTEQGARVSQSPESSTAGKLRYSKFIGDMFVDCEGIELQNVEIGSFLGDVEIKLHGGKLSPGLNRMIISGFIGDVRVLVPQGMAVFAQSSNFIGDIEMMGRRTSGFGNSLDAQTKNYAEAEAKLYVASNHFIGDVRIYLV
jgi:lia operon protein LiaF